MPSDLVSFWQIIAVIWLDKATSQVSPFLRVIELEFEKKKKNQQSYVPAQKNIQMYLHSRKHNFSNKEAVHACLTNQEL